MLPASRITTPPTGMSSTAARAIFAFSATCSVDRAESGALKQRAGRHGAAVALFCKPLLLQEDKVLADGFGGNAKAFGKHADLDASLCNKNTGELASSLLRNGTHGKTPTFLSGFPNLSQF